jgi:serine/threonine protein kinase
MLTWFGYKDHLCITFEMLSLNLYELLKRNNFSGLTLDTVSSFCSQVMCALRILERENIIHCDLKPENILLTLDIDVVKPEVRLIDFGSACFENNTVYSYIQSRFYRSPEVLLGVPYTKSIDCWSLGCIAAELFLGLPLFPGLNQHRQIMRISNMLGTPSKQLLDRGSNSTKFYRREFKKGLLFGEEYEWRLKSDEEFAADTRATSIPPFKNYFKYKTLSEIVMNYPYQSSSVDSVGITKERNQRAAFIHFLLGLLKIDPKERWTIAEATNHPFVTGEPFKGHWKPATDKPVSKLGSSLSSLFGGKSSAPPSSSATAPVNIKSQLTTSNTVYGKSAPSIDYFSKPVGIPTTAHLSSDPHTVTSAVGGGTGGASKTATSSDRVHFATTDLEDINYSSSGSYTNSPITHGNPAKSKNPSLLESLMGGSSYGSPGLHVGSAPVGSNHTVLKKSLSDKNASRSKKGGSSSSIAPSNPRSYKDSRGVAFMEKNIDNLAHNLSTSVTLLKTIESVEGGMNEEYYGDEYDDMERGVEDVGEGEGEEEEEEERERGRKGEWEDFVEDMEL